MIKLDSKNLTRLSFTYSSKMFEDIKKRYLHAVRLKPIKTNPFTHQPYTRLFENSTVYGMDLKLVEDLLTKDIEYLCKHHAELNYYILTCKLVYFSAFKVDKEIKRLDKTISQKQRNSFRKEYIESYRSPWIESILMRHPNFFVNQDNFMAMINEVRKNLIVLNNYISNIVDYSFLTSDLRHTILTGIGVEVCPYCNRQYITPYQKGTKIKSTADLDHFFPKSVFQLLSLSLFNFVPACQICNSRFKLAKSVEILYPYNDGFDNNAVFEFKLNSKSTLESMVGRSTDFELTINASTNSSKKVLMENSIKLFNLEEVYQYHKDYVREILYKKNAYSDTYKSQLKQLFADMSLDLTEINLFLYGSELSMDNTGKRPLSKLTYDIINSHKI